MDIVTEDKVTKGTSGKDKSTKTNARTRKGQKENSSEQEESN